MPELLEATVRLLEQQGLAREAESMRRHYELQDAVTQFDCAILGAGSWSEILAEIELGETKEEAAERADLEDAR